MGQRHQIYVVTTNDSKKYKALGAFHHQWCYGLNAPLNLIRAALLIHKNKTGELLGDKWHEFICYDEREIETVIKATYGVSIDGNISMVHNENDFLIKDGQILPSQGDNNDGCSLIVIDNNKQEIRVGMFTPGHLEGKYWGDKDKKNRVLSPFQYLSYYYKREDFNEYEDKEDALKMYDLVKDQNFNVVEQSELDLILTADKKPKKKGA